MSKTTTGKEIVEQHEKGLSPVTITLKEYAKLICIKYAYVDAIDNQCPPISNDAIRRNTNSFVRDYRIEECGEINL